MGQSYSSNNHERVGSNRDQPEVEEKFDYYELLQVDRNATGEEIKKAYRRKALELHPDRNYGNVEAATKLFAEIQSAYEVLSDPRERTWYDSHREIFLGKSDGKPGEADYSYDTRMTRANDIVKLFSKFSPRMNFTDESTGFYGGLRETFARLALEESMACRWDNIDCTYYPTFGYCNDGYEEVVRPFYAVWSGFSTKKSFSWKDIHRYSEAPDRRVRRLMEKENRRLREEAIKEFNEAVRSLVAFVKKRDPRYKSSAQTELQRQQVLRQSAAAQAARSRAANEAKLRDHIIQDWAEPEGPGDDPSDASEEEVEHFRCVVCHKNFKSDKQLEAHERSKKHMKAMKQLRWEMRAQDKILDLEGQMLDNVINIQPGRPVHGDVHKDSEDNADHAPTQMGTVCNEPETFLDPSEQTLTNKIFTGPDKSTPHIRNSSSSEAKYALADEWPGHDDHSTRVNWVQDIADMPQRFENIKLERPSDTTQTKLGKAKQKRARKAQRAIEQSQDTKCATCNSLFPSRSQLFTHLRDLGHEQPSPTTQRRQSSRKH
ncbi:hypothetical protein BDV25DRAFT_130907 [Aspergillus avenaceus]|uniref:DnaJ-domain-containing protein n=1 Tax=Aspergillus avenaceus TaxID=36643 RepID=A0A5N6TRS0_ASPAV|nr:hypothetical protein BDV25DRAFT_130907 [Aspergillus avenaceus]